MAMNKVQFQKGISIHKFISIYGSEEQCQKRLFTMRWPMGYRCPECGHDKYCQLKSRPLYQCNRCHHQASLTAGTLFAASKLPLRTWFLAIYLLTQEKNGISALELSLQIGVSYNTAWRVKHKLMQTMKEFDDKTPLEYFIQLDDAYWGGVHPVTGGRGAKGKRRFVAAVSTNKEGHPMKMRFSAVDGFKLKEISAWAKVHLKPKSLVISDGLSCFPAVEQAKVFHFPIVTGGGPKSVELPYFQWVNAMISNVKNSMHGTYHAIRLKHLPRYLGEFCFKFNRRFDLENLLEELIYASIRTAPMPQRLLRLAEARW